MFGVLLQNRVNMPAWWFCMMVTCLPVFLSIENTINPEKISNSICRNVAANLHHVACRWSCLLAWQKTKQKVYYFGKIFPICCPFSASTTVVWLFGTNCYIRIISGHTSPDNRGLYLGPMVSASSALLCWKSSGVEGYNFDVYFICCTKLPFPTSSYTIVTVVSVFLLLQKHILKLQSALRALSGKYLADTVYIYHKYTY